MNMMDKAAPIPSSEHPGCTPETLERIRHEMEDLFRHANHDHPVIRELQRLCFLRRISELGSEQ